MDQGYGNIPGQSRQSLEYTEKIILPGKCICEILTNQGTDLCAPARCTDFSGLPPAYTFVGDGEPFFAEAVRYIHKLKKNNIHAELDIYHSNIHAFDMMYPELEISHQAAEKFNRQFT